MFSLISWPDNMRIAHVCPSYYPFIGGVQTHVRELSVRLAKKGFDIEIITTDPSGELKQEEVLDGIRIRRFYSWAPNSAYYFSPGLRSYLARYSGKYDIVHAHNYHAFPAIHAAQARGTKRLIFTPRYHGKGHTFFRNLLHFPYKFLARKVLEKSEKIICISQHEKNLLFSKFNLQKEKVVLIPNGIAKSEFTDLKRDKNQRKILCVSRLEKYKGIDQLIRALPKLHGSISLEIIGTGPYERNLIKMMHELKLDGRIRFRSGLARRELLRRYAKADVFVLLSKYEAFGNTVAEALASGTRCIVANSSALREWVDNRNCFGVDYPIDLDDLAKLINRVMTSYQEGPAVVKLLDWDDVVERIEEIYTGQEHRADEICLDEKT